MIEKFVHQVSNVPGISMHEILGCSGAEIETLKSLLAKDLELPQAYLAFLAFGGKQISDFMAGEHFYYQDSLRWIEEGILEGWRKNLDEDQSFPDMFMIYEHDGYAMAFIRLTEGANPPVYYIDDETNGVIKIFDTFSHFLDAKLDSWILSKELDKSPDPIHNQKVERYKYLLARLLEIYLITEPESLNLKNKVLISKVRRNISQVRNLYFPETASYHDYIIHQDLTFNRFNPSSQYQDEVAHLQAQINMLIEQMGLAKNLYGN